MSAQCPLYPQKQTLIERAGMSALCQKRTSPQAEFFAVIEAACKGPLPQ